MQANTTSRQAAMTSNTAPEAATIETAVRVVASIQVLGGLFGAGRALALYLGTGHPFSFVAMGAYVLSVICGAMLWQQTRAGFAASLLLQLAQIPWILTTHSAYAFASGIGLWLGGGEGGFVRDHAIVSWFHFGTLTGFGVSFDAGPWHYGVNVVAIAIAAFLIINWPSYKSRKSHRAH